MPQTRKGFIARDGLALRDLREPAIDILDQQLLLTEQFNRGIQRFVSVGKHAPRDSFVEKVSILGC